MTVSSGYSPDTYSGNGSTQGFAYTFRILDDDDIIVEVRNNTTEVVTVQTKTTHYTVSGVGDAGGGTITFVTAPASGETVILRRNTAKSQTTDYVENDAFPAQTHEDALDKLTMIGQEVDEEASRAINVSPANTSITDFELKGITASYYLTVNSDGDGFTCIAGAPVEADTGGTGIVVQTGSGTFTPRTITGTSNEIDVTNGDGVSGNPTIGIADNLVIGGTSGAVLPSGTTGERVTTTGILRFNTTGSVYEYYDGSSWQQLNGATGLASLLDDTTPQLGGSLDVNGQKIVSVSNGNIDIEPNGTGNVLLGNFTFDADQTVGAGQDNYVLTYDNGTGLISLEAAAGGSATPFFYFDATDLSAVESNIAPLTYIDGTTVDMLVRAFDDTTEEYVNGKFSLPNTVNSGTVTFRAYVYAATGAASKNVALTFGHKALNDSEDFDAAYTDEDSGDTAIAATQDNITLVEWTETIANLGWASEDIIIFRLSRPAAGANNLSGDMYLLGFSIELP